MCVFFFLAFAFQEDSRHLFLFPSFAFIMQKKELNGINFDLFFFDTDLWIREFLHIEQFGKSGPLQREGKCYVIFCFCSFLF